MKMLSVRSKTTWAILVLGLAPLMAPLAGQAETYSAMVYEKGTKRQKVLFYLKREEQAAGIEYNVKSIYTNPDGTPAVTENVILENGKMKEYRQTQHQLGADALLSVEGGKILFRYTKDGMTRSEEEKLTDNLIIGPTTVEYLRKFWKEILSGGTIETRFAVMDRLETVGFKFFKVGETEVDGKEAIIVKMKPTSIVIAALVDPILFYFSKSDQKLLMLDGRVLPKRKADSKWKDLDAEVVYRYR